MGLAPRLFPEHTTYNLAMKFLFDLLPVILFFVVFKFAGIYAATGVAIAASVAQVGWLKFRRRKVDTMMWVSLAIIVVLAAPRCY